LMWPRLAATLVVLLGLGASLPQAPAQQPSHAETADTRGQEFDRLLQSVRHALRQGDGERLIELVEATLRFADARTDWPLAAPRETILAELWAYLGKAYDNRSKGDKTQNTERAITSYENALRLLSRETNPQGWAVLQVSLGFAFAKRDVGDPAQAVERAISAFRAALTALAPERDRDTWATAQLGLGEAYLRRQDKGESIEQAFEAFTAALTVVSKERSPDRWARSYFNLGRAYNERKAGDGAENRDRAIAALETSLGAVDRRRQPYMWATTHFIFGML